jgi:BMFP domain-containing protein YqiC
MRQGSASGLQKVRLNALHAPFAGPRVAPMRREFTTISLINWRLQTGSRMEKTAFLDELQGKLEALLADTPAADLQRNLKAVLTQQFARLELVTREEFDTQLKVLARTREKLETLETRLAELESKPR